VDAPAGRSQHVLYVVPADPDSAPAFIDPALGHGEPTLVLTRDADSALALAHVIVAAHPDVSVVAATTTARARRVVRNTAVIVGTPTAVLGLVRATALKLDTIKALVIAWANLDDPDLEALMADFPKESPRIVAVDSMTPAVDAFVERYARRPRRVEPAAQAEAIAPAAVQYVTTSAAARPVALGRLLDELDPPSALIHVHRDASERAVRTTLHALGYHGNEAVVRVTRSDSTSGEAAQLVVLYDVPLSAAELHAAVAGSAVNVVALVEPRELPRLRALATATPLTLSGPAARARSREAAVRDELRAALATGLAAAEILTLEPLLSEFDGIELAAAALHLLAQARATVALTPTPVAPTVAAPPTLRREERSRDERPRDERPRRSFGDRPRGDRPRNDRPRSDRPHSDRPHSDRPRSDRDRPHSDRPRSDRPRDPNARPPRSEWAERGERLTHARRPPPRRPDK
jgi:hypothetical protein